MKLKKIKLIKTKKIEIKTYKESKCKYPWWMYVIDSVIGFIISISFVFIKCKQYEVLTIIGLFFVIWILSSLLFFALTYFIFVKRLWVRK